jgi:hypothetical protein
MKLVAAKNSVILGYATFDVTDARFERKFGMYVDRPLDSAQVKTINTNYNVDGVITTLEPIPIFVRPSHVEISTLTRHWNESIRAPKLEWTTEGLEYGIVNVLGGRHRIAAVLLYIQEKRDVIEKLRTSMDKPKLLKDATARTQVQAQIDEADRKIRFASRWLVMVVDGGQLINQLVFVSEHLPWFTDALEALPNSIEVGQFISSNKKRPYRGESDSDGVLAVFRRLAEKRDGEEMLALLKTLRAEAASRLKPILWCHELVLFLRLVVRIPGLKWSSLVDLKRFIIPQLQNVHGGVSSLSFAHCGYSKLTCRQLFIHLLSRAINLMIESCSRPYISVDGDQQLDSPLLELWPLELLQKIDEPFKFIILPVFKHSGILDGDSLATFQDAYVKYATVVSDIIKDHWDDKDALADFNEKEKEAAMHMVRSFRRKLLGSWKQTPGMPVFLPTDSYLNGLVHQWQPLEAATREVSA